MASKHQLELLKTLTARHEKLGNHPGAYSVQGRYLPKKTVRSMVRQGLVRRTKQGLVLSPEGLRLLDRLTETEEKRAATLAKTRRAIIAALREACLADRSADSLHTVIDGRLTEWFDRDLACPQVSMSPLTKRVSLSFLENEDLATWIQIDVWGHGDTEPRDLRKIHQDVQTALEACTEDLDGFAHVWIGCLNDARAVLPGRLLSEWILVASHNPLSAKAERYLGRSASAAASPHELVRAAVVQALARGPSDAPGGARPRRGLFRRILGLFWGSNDLPDDSNRTLSGW